MELWAFDTCNFRCGYCSLVETGDVTRFEQLKQFRDTGFIDNLVNFFSVHRPAGRPWAILITGGEPLMMPNLDRLVTRLGQQGDTAAIYTNNSLPPEKVFTPESFSYLSYVECSFHPDWHLGKFEKKNFFENVQCWIENGVPTLVRFVGAPPLLDILEELEERCKAVGAGFLPTTLFDPKYPKAYTTEQKLHLANSMSGFSSLLQLEGGVNALERQCQAADRLFAVRLHKGGDITPCISVDRPVLGNIYKNTLIPREGPNNCFKFDGLCTCDVHFQQHIVIGVDDSENFAKIVMGERLHSAKWYDQWKSDNNIQTIDEIWAGQGVITPTRRDLLKKPPKSRIK